LDPSSSLEEAILYGADDEGKLKSEIGREKLERTEGHDISCPPSLHSFTKAPHGPSPEKRNSRGFCFGDVVLVDARGTDAIIPVQVGIIGHAPLAQVANTFAGGGGGAAEIGVFVNGDGGAAEHLDGADFIVERDLGNLSATLATKIFTRKVDVLIEAGAAPGPAVGISSAAGVPPTGAAGGRVDAEARFAAAIHPDAFAIIAPGFAANAGSFADLLDENDNGARFVQGAVLNAMMAGFADDGISGFVALRSGSCGKEKKKQ